MNRSFGINGNILHVFQPNITDSTRRMTIPPQAVDADITLSIAAQQIILGSYVAWGEARKSRLCLSSSDLPLWRPAENMHAFLRS